MESLINRPLGGKICLGVHIALAKKGMGFELSIINYDAKCNVSLFVKAPITVTKVTSQKTFWPELSLVPRPSTHSVEKFDGARVEGLGTRLARANITPQGNKASVCIALLTSLIACSSTSSVFRSDNPRVTAGYSRLSSSEIRL